MDCEFTPWAVPSEVVPFGAAECMVVRVVVSDRTDGAGDENVLSAPRPELTPPSTVVFPPPDEAPCDGAASSTEAFAVDLLPIVGGGWPSTDVLTECLLLLMEDMLTLLPVGAVEND